MARIHLSANEELERNRTYPPKLAANSEFKPNGLWYAIDDAWHERVRVLGAESIASYKFKFVLEIDFSQMCILENVQELLVFHRKYSYKCGYGCSAIHWDRVMKDYAGIELRDFENLMIDSAFRGIIWPRNCEMDSGCIWALEAVKWKRI
jgi:hypothetical protein